MGRNLNADAFQPCKLMKGAWVRPNSDQECVDAFHEAAALLRKASVGSAEVDDLICRLEMVDLPEAGRVRVGEDTPARQKIAEAREAIYRYRSVDRDLLDQRRDFQDCVYAIYTAICRIEDELISRSRSDGVPQDVRRDVRGMWPKPAAVEASDPLIGWVLRARHTDNHRPSPDPVLRLTGTFSTNHFNLTSRSVLTMEQGGYLYQYTDEGTDRELKFIVGRAPVQASTLKWVAVNAPTTHLGSSVSSTSIEDLLSDAVEYLLDLYVESRRPLTELATRGADWINTWGHPVEP